MKFIQSEIAFKIEKNPHKKRFKDEMVCGNDEIMPMACQRIRKYDIASVTKSQLDNFFQKSSYQKQQQHHHHHSDEGPALKFYFELKMKKRRKWYMPWMSISAQEETCSKPCEKQIEKTFDEMDIKKKGYVDENDLRDYAERHGLPKEYASQFMNAANEQNKKNEESKGIDMNVFKTYVKSREAALKRAFNLFDFNKDGKIDANELELGLSHIRVKCPISCCVYSYRKKCIKELLAKVDFNGDKMIDFCEFRKFFVLLPENDMLVDYWVSAKSLQACDVGGCVVMHDTKLEKKSAWKGDSNPWGHLFAGALAGAASRTATAPLETLRLSAMTGAIPANLTTFAAFQSVIQGKGWHCLYKGNLTNVMKSAPQKALDFFVFDAFKNLLKSKDDNEVIGPVKTFTAAGMAGVVSNVILYPLEVIRSRLTIDNIGKYKGAIDAMQKIVRKEGVKALYKGVGPSAIAILPEAAIVYGLFDLLKKSYIQMNEGKVKEPNVILSLSFGVFSAFMGQLVAYPFETISRRMQVNSSSGSSFGMALNEIIKENGVKGLYRGLGPATVRVIPMAIVSFGTYEIVKAWIKNIEEVVDYQNAQLEHLKYSKSSEMAMT